MKALSRFAWIFLILLFIWDQFEWWHLGLFAGMMLLAFLGALGIKRMEEKKEAEKNPPKEEPHEILYPAIADLIAEAREVAIEQNLPGDILTHISEFSFSLNNNLLTLEGLRVQLDTLSRLLTFYSVQDEDMADIMNVCYKELKYYNQ